MNHENEWIKNTGVRPDVKKIIIKFDDGTLNGSGPVTPKLFIWDIDFYPKGNISHYKVIEQ